MTVLTVPSVEFAGFYYPEILRELLSFFRRNAEEIGLTDENELEVHVQLLRAFALVGHLTNTRLDTVATELVWDSARLLESVKRMTKLMGGHLASASPSTVDILLKLSTPLPAPVVGFVPELAEFATESTPPITYEDLTGMDVSASDVMSHSFGLQQTKSGVNGLVATASPDIFARSGADDSFVSGDVNNHIFTTGVNGGERRVVEFISTDQVRVVDIPGSGNPQFQTEGGIAWVMKKFSADLAPTYNSSGPTVTPWAASPVAGDALYVGHDEVMFGQLNFTFGAVASGLVGCFEYFDNTHSSFAPISVTDPGNGTIAFNINSLLGTPDRSGADVVVENLITRTKETVKSVFSGGVNQAITKATLGQVSVSTNLEHYRVTAEWIPLENQNDNTVNLTTASSLSYNFPQSQERNWQQTEVNIEAGYWLRYRLISVTTPTAPLIDRIRIDQGEQYLARRATQGETIGPQIIGSGDASKNQTFVLPDTPFLDGTELIEVDEGGGGTWIAYTENPSLLDSLENSRHYEIETDSQDQATIKTGDGVRGKLIPAGSDNVRATYRIGGDQDGNVGANEINVNADGVNGVAEVTNPRSATGWRIKEGGNDADLERVKRDKPAALRTRETGGNVDDIPRLAINSFTDRDGGKPVERAFAVEEAFGIKTIKLLTVGNGGSTLTSTQKTDLEEYFNGNRTSQVEGKLIANHRITVQNFEPKLITVQATVVWSGGNPELIRAALLSLLSPLATEDDGLTWVHDFNGQVSLSRVYSEIHEVDANIEDIPSLILNGNPASVTLGGNELPISTAGSIIVNLQEA